MMPFHFSSIETEWQRFLVEVHSLVSATGKPAPKIFISYAWESSNEATESMQQRLALLQRDLLAAGAYARVQQNYQQLLKRFELTEIALKEQVETFSKTQITLTVLTQENEQLRQFQQQAEDKIHALRDEKFFLIQEKSHLQGQFKQLQASLTS